MGTFLFCHILHAGGRRDKAKLDRGGMAVVK